MPWLLKQKEQTMLKTLFATTALATMLAWSAQAQTQPAPADDATTTPPILENEMAPDAEMTSPDADTAEDTAAPAVPAPADSQMAQEPPATVPAPMMEEGWAPVDMATISTDSLIGKDIRTYEQDTVAAVEDVLIAPDGKVESLVARFGGFLGFGETTVLLGMEEVSVVKDADDNVVLLTNLTPEALKDRPEYVAPEG